MCVRVCALARVCVYACACVRVCVCARARVCAQETRGDEDVTEVQPSQVGQLRQSAVASPAGRGSRPD